jgi:hypothetical protein
MIYLYHTAHSDTNLLVCNKKTQSCKKVHTFIKCDCYQIFNSTQQSPYCKASCHPFKNPSLPSVTALKKIKTDLTHSSLRSTLRILIQLHCASQVTDALSTHPQCEQPTKIWFRLQIMKHIIQFSPANGVSFSVSNIFLCIQVFSL